MKILVKEGLLYKLTYIVRKRKLCKPLYSISHMQGLTQNSRSSSPFSFSHTHKNSNTCLVLAHADRTQRLKETSIEINDDGLTKLDRFEIISKMFKSIETLS